MLSPKGDSRRLWSDNRFHGRCVSAGEVEPGFRVEPEPSLGVDIATVGGRCGAPTRTSNVRRPPSKPRSQTRAPRPAAARRIAPYHPFAVRDTFLNGTPTLQHDGGVGDAEPCPWRHPTRRVI